MLTVHYIFHIDITSSLMSLCSSDIPWRQHSQLQYSSQFTFNSVQRPNMLHWYYSQPRQSSQVWYSTQILVFTASGVLTVQIFLKNIAHRFESTHDAGILSKIRYWSQHKYYLIYIYIAHIPDIRVDIIENEYYTLNNSHTRAPPGGNIHSANRRKWISLTVWIFLTNLVF